MGTRLNKLCASVPFGASSNSGRGHILVQISEKYPFFRVFFVFRGGERLEVLFC